MEKSFKYTISSFLIITTIMMSFGVLSIEKAEADNSIAGYITSLAPVIIKMPGCKNTLGGGVSGLFSKVKDLFTSKAKKEATQKAKDAIDSAILETVGVSDAETRKGIIDANNKLDAQKKAQEKMENNQNCLNGIGKAIAKVLINKATDSIINWINTGDTGDALFTTNTGQYFKDIVENNIIGLGIEINDPNLYPFGQDFIQAQKNSFQAKFANNAQYSLNKMIQDANPRNAYTAETFNKDFSQGGWGAWDALIQNAANNPLGFSIMAENELGKRIEKETNLAAGSLQMSGGFFGVQKCNLTDPVGSEKSMTKDIDIENRNKRFKDPTDKTSPICVSGHWQDVTPGKLVGDMLVSTVDKKDHALLDVATLNDAMAAILDTVLAKFSSMLTSKKGLASVTDSDPYSYDTSVSGFGNNQNELDYTNAQINSSEWLKQNPDFNIRTDLNDALIDEQRIYQNKLIEQNKELSSTTDGKDYAIDPATGKSNAYGLIPTIYQLDYCIPGPHPGWEADSGNELDKELSKVLDTDGMDFLQVGQATGMSTNLGAGIMIVSKLLGVADTDTIDEWSKILGTGHAHCGSSPPVSISECVSRDYYVKELLRFTHIPALSVDSDYLQSYSKFTNIIDRIYTEYKAGIKNTYISEVLPSAAKESETEFAKVPGYDQIINANRKTIDTLNGTITRLKEIKFKIDEANAKLKSGTMSVDDYETGPDGITPWKNAFVRVSYSLYSGDDIATVDDDTKLFIDEKNYVLNSLIGGHTGCEEELASPNSQLPKQLSGGSVLGRPDYPLPILYKYPGPSEKGFLYWGHYMDWQGHFPDGYAIGQAVDLCKAYVKYNKSTDEGCSSIVGIPDYNHIKGPNYIHISDLLEIQDGGTTGTIGYSPLNLPKAGDFERDILKMW